MEQLINFIIRPPRAEYDPNQDLLDQEFVLKGKWFHRKDVEIKNSRGDVLKCSHYMPIVSPDEKPLPCVIYCHGNSGCRADASEAAIILLPSNITVFTLDFSGSGLSGGEHVSLGWHEKGDLRAAVDYLRADGNVSLIGLWGRSMGSVTSLMYGAEDPSIAGMVLDSPFSDLVDLMMELTDGYKFRLPKFTVKLAIQHMRKAIMKKAKFDIVDLNTIKVAKSCFVPVLLGHAIDDDFIRPHHSDRIFDAYVGDKNIIKFEGDHNSPRPQFYFDSINIFFHNVLHPPEDEVGGTFIDPMHDYFDKDTWHKLHEVEYADHDSLGLSTEPATGITKDATEQLRPKRPMSRTEVPYDVPSEENQFEGQDAGDEKQPFPSSSNMISFELSKGRPYGPHVPISIDDDLYVEYPLDSVADFPSNEEEEKRMFMEAVLMSLKDLNMRHPDEEKQPPRDGTNLPKSSQGDDPNASSLTKCCKTESASTSLGSSEGPAFDTPMFSAESESIGNSARSDESIGVQSSTDTGKTKTGLTSNVPADGLSSSDDDKVGNTKATSTNDAPSSVQSSSDTEMVGNTKATLTVVKSPTSHIMDGLLRRWDLNFFRNSR